MIAFFIRAVIHKDRLIKLVIETPYHIEMYKQEGGWAFITYREITCNT